MSCSLREEDFQGFCNFFHFGCYGNQVMDGIKFCKQFCRASPKEHPCKVSSRLAQCFRRRRCLKKLLTDHRQRTPDAGRRAITIAHSEHFVLRWAKNDDFTVVSTGTAMFTITWLEFQNGSHLETDEVRCRFIIDRVVTNAPRWHFFLYIDIEKRV